MPLDHWLLKHIDGNYQIITPPPVLDHNLQFHARYIKLHHEALRSAIAGQQVWPPEQVADDLYGKFFVYYQKLGALFNPGINTDILDPIDRHLFFIATEPVELSGQWVPGLSGLEKLMGYRYPDPEAPKQPEPEYTTGSSELDILVDTLLIFKRNGYSLAQMMGLDELSRCCVQANNRMRVKDESDDVEMPETWEEDAEFVEQQEDIENALSGMGVEMPSFT